jgi:hypothetical protein
MAIEETIMMLREYSERGSEEDFAEAADFLAAFQYENKEYRKIMTAQVARIKELQAALQLAIEMRLTQKLYFKERTPDLLISSKMSEAAFDRAMLETSND